MRRLRGRSWGCVMASRDEAIRAAAVALAVGYEVLENAPLEEAVEAAFTPTGPSREELRRRICARRGIPVPEVVASP